MAEAKPYLTIQDVARRFGVNVSTIYHLAQRGVLPGFKIGNQWRFNLEMLESWVTDRVTMERLRTDHPGRASHPKLTRRETHPVSPSTVRLRLAISPSAGSSLPALPPISGQAGGGGRDHPPRTTPNHPAGGASSPLK